MAFIDLPVLQPAAQPKVPSSLVVRYGYMRMMGEFPYDGDARPGCGAKVVIRTRRGEELAEVVTTTCSNGGCAKSVTRDKIAEYIENSGGSQYPFTTEGRVLRIATPEDIKRQAGIDAGRPNYIGTCKTLIRELELPMKLVEVELLLGEEMVLFYYMSEERVDFRNLVRHLAAQFHSRIQMQPVGARDEARLVADYETCGEHCCCRQFLKVLKPVNMASAKMQKATLDPNKISGRCGRLKCCIRYEEETYDELRAKLPNVGSRVRTSEGAGVVLEVMILTQLVKVRLDSDRMAAVANEEILERNLPATQRQPIKSEQNLTDEPTQREIDPPRRNEPRADGGDSGKPLPPHDEKAGGAEPGAPSPDAGNRGRRRGRGRGR